MLNFEQSVEVANKLYKQTISKLQDNSEMIEAVEISLNSNKFKDSFKALELLDKIESLGEYEVSLNNSYHIFNKAEQLQAIELDHLDAITDTISSVCRTLDEIKALSPTFILTPVNFVIGYKEKKVIPESTYIEKQYNAEDFESNTNLAIDKVELFDDFLASVDTFLISDVDDIIFSLATSINNYDVSKKDALEFKTSVQRLIYLKDQIDSTVNYIEGYFPESIDQFGSIANRNKDAVTANKMLDEFLFLAEKLKVKSDKFITITTISTGLKNCPLENKINKYNGDKFK